MVGVRSLPIDFCEDRVSMPVRRLTVSLLPETWVSRNSVELGS
jgi:hypothetical protein